MPTSTIKITPLGAILRGLVAGAVGTAAMDVVWYLRYRRGGGKQKFLDWELSTDLTSWEKAPAPALIGKRIVEGFTGQALPPERAAFMNNVMHWAYGIGWGTAYGISAGSLPRPFVARAYDPKTLWKDLSAHLAYGTGTAATFARLTRG